MESKLNLKNLPPTTKWEAGSATTVWLICLQSFSVYKYIKPMHIEVDDDGEVFLRLGTK